MTITNEKIEDLKYFIKEGDGEGAIAVLEDLQSTFPQDEESVGIITMPEVITELHGLLQEHLGVHPRAMMLKGRVPHRGRRAHLFAQAMINGIKLSK